MQFKLLTISIITGGVAGVGTCAAPGERHWKLNKQWTFIYKFRSG